MPIDKFLNYLQDSDKVMTISTGTAILKNVHVSSHVLEPGSSVSIYTKEGHEVFAKLEEFKEIAFDAIVYRTPTYNCIEYCLSHLEDEDRFSAYFYDREEVPILSFYNIKNEKPEKGIPKADIYTMDELKMVRGVKKLLAEVFENDPSFCVKKERTNQFIYFNSKIKMLSKKANQLRDISDPPIKLEDYEVHWCEILQDKENVHNFFFETQISDNDCIYVLLGKVEKAKLRWQGDIYDKERLVLIAGLYGFLKESPRILREISEENLVEIERLLKKALLAYE